MVGERLLLTGKWKPKTSAMFHSNEEEEYASAPAGMNRTSIYLYFEVNFFCALLILSEFSCIVSNYWVIMNNEWKGMWKKVSGLGLI
jgi:hypothetical protein